MRRRHVAGLGFLVVAALLLAGCGGLPTSRSIRIERSVSAQPEEQPGAIRVLAPGPKTGATPKQIVTGFLGAQADATDDYAVARSYLTPDSSWSPEGAVSVYSNWDVQESAARLAEPGAGAGSAPPASGQAAPGASGSPSLSPSSAPSASVGADGTRTTVTTRLTMVARIDLHGVYTAASRPQVLQVPLEVVGGQWRITTVPAGLLIRIRDLNRSYAPEMLWWWNSDQTMLVPEMRWLPASPGALPTLLVKALLAGPQSGLGDAVRTAVPPGTTLRGSATVVGSDVLVDLDRTAAGLGVTAATALLKQLAQTLMQVPGVSGVRLTVDGQSLPLPGLPSRVPVTIVGDSTPDNPIIGGAFALRGGSPVALDAGASVPAAVERLSGSGLTALAITDGGKHAAGLIEAGDGRSRIVLATPTAGPTPVGDAASYLSVGYDAGGELLLARPTGLTLLTAQGGVVQIDKGLPQGPIVEAAIARDGVRVALIAGTSGHRALYLGVLVHDGNAITLSDVRPLTPSLADVQHVAWAGSGQLDLLAAETDGSAVAFWTSAPDGSQLQSTPLGAAITGTPTAIAAGGPSDALIVAAGTVYERAVVGWRDAGPGAGPTYIQ